MEFRLVILSVACISCLIPSALSFHILAAKAVAGEAAQDIADIGAKTLVAKKEAVAKAAAEIANIAAEGVARKGEVISKAASSMLGAMIKGAVSIGSRIARAGLDMVAAKFGVQPAESTRVVYEPSTIVYQRPVVQDAVVEETIVPEPVMVEEIEMPVRPQFIDLPAPPQLSSVWTTVEEAAPAFEIVGPADSPYIYEIVGNPQAYETFEYLKK